MPDDEYDSFDRHVLDRVDAKKGIKAELDRIFRRDPNLRPEPSRKQLHYVRKTITNDEDVETATFKARGNKYVKTGTNKYERVQDKEDVYYNPSNDTLYAQDESGDWKGVG